MDSGKQPELINVSSMETRWLDIGRHLFSTRERSMRVKKRTGSCMNIGSAMHLHEPKRVPMT